MLSSSSLPILPPKLTLARKTKKKEESNSSNISNQKGNHHIVVPVPTHPVPPPVPVLPPVPSHSNASHSVHIHQVPSDNNIPTVIHSMGKEENKLERKNKIGSYASTEFQNWLNTPIQKPKIKRSKKTNDEAFQIFLDFAEKIDNEDWKTFFNKLYTGKFPHGYSFRNQTLFFRKRTKIEKLDIQDTSNETMNKVINFFKNFGGFSNFGEDTNIFDFLVSKTPVFKNWKDIRSKKTKQFFITKYVDDLSLKYNLNSCERKGLLDTIHAGFLLKSIESCDIEFEEYKIQNIKTIHWQPETRKFVLDLEHRVQKPSRKTTADRIAKNSFLVHWTKFIQQILKENNNINNEDIPTDVSVVSIDTDDLTDNTSVSISSITDS